MNPLEQKIKELEERLSRIERLDSVPFIEKGKRLMVEPLLEDPMNKSSDSDTTGMTQSVAESGASSYTVAKVYDGSLIVYDKLGNQYKLGYYTV